MNNTKINITITYYDGNTLRTTTFDDVREVPPTASVPAMEIWTQTLTGLESILSKVHFKLFPDDTVSTPPLKNENTN